MVGAEFLERSRQEGEDRAHSLLLGNQAKRETDPRKVPGSQADEDRSIERCRDEEEAFHLLCGAGGQSDQVCRRRGAWHGTETIPGMWQQALRTVLRSDQEADGRQERNQRGTTGPTLDQNESSHHREHPRTRIHLQISGRQGTEGHARHHERDGNISEELQHRDLQAQGQRSAPRRDRAGRSRGESYHGRDRRAYGRL
eukprot:9977570-Heterocapsa_arctica.AAC.1